jgi:hypothetical protein
MCIARGVLEKDEDVVRSDDRSTVNLQSLRSARHFNAVACDLVAIAIVVSHIALWGLTAVSIPVCLLTRAVRTVAVRLMPRFSSCPAEHHYEPPKHEAVEPHTIDIITRYYSAVVNRPLRLVCTT